MTSYPDGVLGHVDVPVMSLPMAGTTVYALEGERGIVLVDAGWGDDAAWRALDHGLAGLGASITEVEGIVLTHHHPDHAGLAERIRDRTDCWVAMHELDAVALRENRDIPTPAHHLQWEERNLLRAGAPRRTVIDYHLTGGSYALGLPMCPVDRELSDGDAVRVAAGTLRSLWLPGHTAGHLGLVLEEQRAVFTGDHVLARTTPHIGEFEFPVDRHGLLDGYLRSLDRVAGYLDAGYSVLPAHEGVEVDWTLRIGELRDSQLRRLDDVRTVLDDGGARTLWEVAAAMRWAIPWDEIDPIGYQLALSEASAHVSHLAASGEVVTDHDPRGVLLFRPVARAGTGSGPRTGTAARTATSGTSTATPTRTLAHAS